MQRRAFIRTTSLVAMSVSAFGAVRWDGNMYVGDSPTTTDILGPFYRPGAPMRSNLIPPGSNGIPLNLSGTIFSHDGKTRLSNVLVEIWQCDEKEYYDNTSDDYRFRGAVKTGKDGRYEFRTIVPVPYKANPTDDSSWRPAHIHMRVSSSNQQDLVTQIYFEGDKYNEKDRSSSAPEAVNRILKISKNASGESTVTFDVVMSKEFPLDAAVYEKITGLYKMDNMTVEFIKSDDLLFIKINGQLVSSVAYVGNNSFEGAMGYPKVKFELLPQGVVKANVTNRNASFSGERFLKYAG